MSQSGGSIVSGEPRIYLVAAVAANGIIGVDGRLPWHLPEDLQHFKRLTMGHPIIMGARLGNRSARRCPGGKTLSSLEAAAMRPRAPRSPIPSRPPLPC